MRDYLLAHPEAVSAYGDLKKRLAKELTEDSLAYTRAKAGFIQDLMDKARTAIGLPLVDVYGLAQLAQIRLSAVGKTMA